MFIDSHCHLNLLDLTPYQDDLHSVLNQAQEKGVNHFLCVSVTLKDFEDLKKIAENHDNVSISVGLHPNEDPEKPLSLTPRKRHYTYYIIG